MTDKLAAIILLSEIDIPHELQVKGKIPHKRDVCCACYDCSDYRVMRLRYALQTMLMLIPALEGMNSPSREVDSYDVNALRSAWDKARARLEGAS